MLENDETENVKKIKTLTKEDAVFTKDERDIVQKTFHFKNMSNLTRTPCILGEI